MILLRFISCNCGSSLLGWTSYELVRAELSKNGIQSTTINAMMGGACATFAVGLIGVPGEILSQHLSKLGIGAERRKDLKNNPLNVNISQSKSKVAMEVIKNLYLIDGIPGFYRGFGATLVSRIPQASLTWAFFYQYTSLGLAVVPSVVPYSIIEILATMTAAVTSTMLLNPLEVLRTQIQVKRAVSYTHLRAHET